MNIGSTFWNVVNQIIGFIPNLIAFLVLLVVGYLVAKLVAAGVRKVMQRAEVDRRIEESDTHRYMKSAMGGGSATRLTSRVVFWVIFAFFLVAAIGALQISALTRFMDQVIAYIPNVIAAILIFAVAAIVAGVVSAAANRLLGDSPSGKVAGTVLPALVMVIAVFMILQQLRIAEGIVQIAFAATMGALALGFALAFGLGGRAVAQRMLEDAYTRSQESRERARREREARERVPHMRSAPGEETPSPAHTAPRQRPGTEGGEPPRTP
ncbi:mechanosensitive ion channel family protein [Thermasporomyces composti]|uniref:Putative transporter (Transmembrane protein) n=1 Tax=Thermasporomyces composti TaxID=696763 RepID=A0A3D9V4C3_THECX|nr:transporter [Thermasporomyces composti]REF36357.1 putative transporter (transmembrane protein) [Thermasporomyces composti]